MGCDIHAFKEVKVNGKWMSAGEVDVDRNYALFSRMAGVRGSDPEQVEPRGLPDDVSDFVQVCAKDWGIDGHTHSWLSGEEVHELEMWYRHNVDKHRWAPFGYIFGNGWGEIDADYRPDGYEDCRLVFWFDN